MPQAQFSCTVSVTRSPKSTGVISPIMSPTQEKTFRFTTKGYPTEEVEPQYASGQHAEPTQATAFESPWAATEKKLPQEEEPQETNEKHETPAPPSKAVFAMRDQAPEYESPARASSLTLSDNEKGQPDQPIEATEEDNFEYPTGWKLALILISIYIGMFLVALDKLIISTATPAITNEFHAASDIGWYGTAYLLTNCAFLLVFGKLYTFLNVKYTFLSAVMLFEIGSTICGAAPNSVSFIIGRAIAGLGAGGVQAGVVTLIVYAVPLEKRPMFQGLFGAVYGISSVLGPLVGGAFTTNVTWRWCFYINLPLGGFVLVFIFFLLKLPDRPKSAPVNLKEKFAQLNIEGQFALIPGVICLCLALQWGGFTYAWSSGRVVALLTIAFACIIAFIAIQIWKPHRATVPPRIFKQRSIWSGFFVSACLGAHQTLILYYLPLWFQAIKGDSAVKSGVHLLPQVLALVVASILTGVLTTKTGYYTPFLIIGICITAVGAGLLTTLQLNTVTGAWIGFQILYGWGFGGCIQAPNMAAQTVLPRDEVSIGASLMLFAQTLFGAIFVSIGQNVIDSKLATRLGAIPGLVITPQQIESSGATNLFKMIPTEYLHTALEAYNDSIRAAFQVGLIMACLAIFGGIAMEWKSVKVEAKKQEEDNMEEQETDAAHAA